MKRFSEKWSNISTDTEHAGAIQNQPMVIKCEAKGIKNKNLLLVFFSCATPHSSKSVVQDHDTEVIWYTVTTNAKLQVEKF